MKLIIDSNLRMLEKTATSFFKEVTFGEFYIFGNLLGAFDGEKILTFHEVIKMLEDTSGKIEEIKKIIRICVGSFYFLVKSDIQINLLCSTQSIGSFYTIKENNIIFCDSEKEIAKIKHGDSCSLNEMAVLDVILNPYKRHPFISIFDDIKRITGGQLLTLERGLIVDISFIVLKNEEDVSNSRQRDYEGFVSHYDAVAKIIADGTIDRKKYLFLSGGSDSSAFLAAFLKFNKKILPIHFLEKKNEARMAKIICRQLNIGLLYSELDYADYNFLSDEDAKLFMNYYQNSYSMPLLHQLIVPSVNFINKDGGEKKIIFDLDSMDSVYSVAAASKGFSLSDLKLLFTFKVRPKYIWPQIISNLRGLFYSKFWYNQILGKKVLKTKLIMDIILGKNKFLIPNKIIDCLLGMSLTIGKPIPAIPLSILPDNLSDLQEDYIKYIKTTVVEPFLEYSRLTIKLEKNIIDSKYFNHLLRVFNFVINVQRGRLTEFSWQRGGGYECIDPSAEGPMIDFFMDFQLSLRQALDYKGFEYKYLKDKCNIDLKSMFHNNPYLETIFARAYKKLKGQKTFVSKQENFKIIFKSNFFERNFRKFFNPDESYLLASLKNQLIKNYLFNFYQSAYWGKYDKINHRVLEVLLNMEIYLRSL